MTINIPPIDVMAFLQQNVIQALLATILSVIIGFSQKIWVMRVVYFLIALYPAFYLAGLAIEMFLIQNWRYAIGAILVSIGTYVWTKGSK